MTIVERRSISEPPYFDGENCAKWKEHMKIFIQSVDFKLWLVIKNGTNIPKETIKGEELEKSENEFNEEDMKMMEQEAKAKHILFCALNPDDHKRVSWCKKAKEIWDELDKSSVHTFQYETEKTTYNIDSLEEKSNYKEKTFLNLCALKGNWPATKRVLDKKISLRKAAITNGGRTILHIAAGANHIEFVKNLLIMLQDAELELLDMKGNTAFCLAAAVGNIEIVNLMLERNLHLPFIRGSNGYTPIQYAALQGKYKMTWHLYDQTIPFFEEEDWSLLFFACIQTGIYDLAIKMARDRNALVFARHANGETALHMLAQTQMCFDSSYRDLEHDYNPIKINPEMKVDEVSQLVKFLWTKILDSYSYSEPELREIINEPFQLLFKAAEVGNFEFLLTLIGAYPSLLWNVDHKHRTILHIAVLHRHANIFNLVHRIDDISDITIPYKADDEGNTLLHMAAKLPPRSQLEMVSGAAFQMCLEILWFEVVKTVMPPTQIKYKNSEGLTAQDLFLKEHKKLREDGESWMKKTAESCMLISTVIATGVFTAATSLPGGTNDDTGKPNYLSKTSFLVFAISDALALISSSTALLIFLAILVSRYREYDFYKSLPLKLILGLITLFISIVSMMVAFSSAFFIIYYHGSKWVPSLVAMLSFLPILFYTRLQFSIFSDIFYATNYWRMLSKSDKNMIYVLEK